MAVTCREMPLMEITVVGSANVRLRPLRVGDERVVRAAQAAMDGDEFRFAFGLTRDVPWASFLAQRTRERAGVELPPGRVPPTFLLAELGGVLVGRTSIRHRLDDWLLAHAGHIGYGVLPEFRRRGLATEILRQSLVVARALGIDRVLVTCDEDNVGSIKAIERCGGRRDEQWPSTPGDVPIRRYWID